jgi:hypothetical protein
LTWHVEASWPAAFEQGCFGLAEEEAFDQQWRRRSPLAETPGRRRPRPAQPVGYPFVGPRSDRCDASGIQPAKWAHRRDKRNDKPTRLKDRRDKPYGCGNGKSGKTKNTSGQVPFHRLAPSRSSTCRELGPARPGLDWPPLLRAAATALRRRSRLSLAGFAPRVRGRLARPRPMAVGRRMLLLPIAPDAVWSGFLTLAGYVVGVASRFDRSLGGHRIRLLVLVRALGDLGGSARVIVACARSRGRFRYSRRLCALAFAGRPDSRPVAGSWGRLSTRRG